MEITISNNGSLDFAIDKWGLGFWSDSQCRSCLYFKNNSIYIAWDEYDNRVYFNLYLEIGRLRIKVDI